MDIVPDTGQLSQVMVQATAPAFILGAVAGFISILVLLAGPAAPTSLSAGPGLTLWQLPINGQTTNSVALTGTLVNGPILIIGVEDVNKVGDYGAVIQDVAANGTYALRNKSSYSVTVAKQ